MNDLFQIIELSVAPVFMLAGIGGLLNVMSGRLGRVVDRARTVEDAIAREQFDDVQLARANAEIDILWNRIVLSNWSIGLCTFSALLVCLLVVGMFSANLLPYHFEAGIKFLFIASLLVLIVSLTTFLLEIRLATKSLRAGKEYRASNSS
jgi:hypothetical protein